MRPRHQGWFLEACKPTGKHNFMQLVLAVPACMSGLGPQECKLPRVA
jgi:hypothetical protein